MVAPKTQKHNSWKQVLLIWLHITGLVPWLISVYYAYHLHSHDVAGFYLFFIGLLASTFTLIPLIIDIVFLSQILSKKLGGATEAKILAPILIILCYVAFIILSSINLLPELGPLPELLTVFAWLLVLLKRYTSNNGWLKTIGLTIVSIASSYVFFTLFINLFFS